MKNGVHETTEYLEMFLRNLLLDEKGFKIKQEPMHLQKECDERRINSMEKDE